MDFRGLRVTHARITQKKNDNENDWGSPSLRQHSHKHVSVPRLQELEEDIAKIVRVQVLLLGFSMATIWTPPLWEKGPNSARVLSFKLAGCTPRSL